MSAKFLTNIISGNQLLYEERIKSALLTRSMWAIGLGLWIYVAFTLSAILVVSLRETVKRLLPSLGDKLDTVNLILQTFVLAALIYAVTIAVVFAASTLIKRGSINRRSLGLQRLVKWKDIGAAPIGLVVYFVISALLVTVVGLYFKDFNVNQAQDTGFTNLFGQSQYLLAFVALVVIAPVAEEILIRGFLYGKLRKLVPLWVAILITSITFGALHGQWNVGIDVFALSIVLCLLRETTGSIWAGILLHMLKNGLAYYFLFVNPLALSTM